MQSTQLSLSIQRVTLETFVRVSLLGWKKDQTREIGGNKAE